MRVCVGPVGVDGSTTTTTAVPQIGHQANRVRSIPEEGKLAQTNSLAHATTELLLTGQYTQLTNFDILNVGNIDEVNIG